MDFGLYSCVHFRRGSPSIFRKHMPWGINKENFGIIRYIFAGNGPLEGGLESSLNDTARGAKCDFTRYRTNLNNRRVIGGARKPKVSLSYLSLYICIYLIEQTVQNKTPVSYHKVLYESLSVKYVLLNMIKGFLFAELHMTLTLIELYEFNNFIMALYNSSCSATFPMQKWNGPRMDLQTQNANFSRHDKCKDRHSRSNIPFIFSN